MEVNVLSIYKQLTLFGVAKGTRLGKYSEDEKRKLKIKIEQRMRNKPSKPLRLYINREAGISLIIEYMYGATYHIKKDVAGKIKPLNLWSKIDQLIDIIEREKFS